MPDAMFTYSTVMRSGGPVHFTPEIVNINNN